MKYSPSVSVITPSYNQGHFIEQCMLSIINQSYRNIEHIVVDGESTDETLSIIKKYEGKYNMKWISSPDEGMYDAINKGLEIAQGDILAYLNCDDLYLPWSVEIAVKYLQNYDIVFGDSILCNERMSCAYLHFTPPFIFGYYKSSGVIVQPTVFFKRKVFLNIGKFDNHTFKLLADCDYWLRCALSGYKPKKIFEFLAIQRDHDMMQRVTKHTALKSEFKLFRANYSERNWIKTIYYGVIMRMYWRFAFLLYCSGYSSLWNKTRNKKITNLSYGRAIKEVTIPFSVRKSLLSRKPYLQLDKVTSSTRNGEGG